MSDYHRYQPGNRSPIETHQKMVLKIPVNLFSELEKASRARNKTPANLVKGLIEEFVHDLRHKRNPECFFFLDSTPK